MSSLLKLTSSTSNGSTYTGILKTEYDIGSFFGSIGGVLVSDIRRLSYLYNGIRYYIGFITNNTNEIFINDNLTLDTTPEVEIEEENEYLLFAPSGYFIKKEASKEIMIYKKYYNKDEINTVNISITDYIEIVSNSVSVLKDNNGNYKKIQLNDVVFEYDPEKLLFDIYGTPMVFDDFLINNVTGFKLLVDKYGYIKDKYIKAGMLTQVTWKYVHDSRLIKQARCLEYTELDSYFLLDAAEFASQNPSVDFATYVRPTHSFRLFYDQYCTEEVAYYSDEETFVLSWKEFEVRDKNNSDTIFKVNKSKGYILDKEIITKDVFNKDTLGLSRLKNMFLNTETYLSDDENKYESTFASNNKFKKLQTVINEMYIKIKGLVPKNLNTLEKLAKAVNNDPAFSTTVNARIDAINTTVSGVTSGGATKAEVQAVQTDLNNYKTSNDTNITTMKATDTTLGNRITNTENSLTALNSSVTTLQIQLNGKNSDTGAITEQISELQDDVQLLQTNSTGLVSNGADVSVAGNLLLKETHQMHIVKDANSAISFSEYNYQGVLYQMANCTFTPPSTFNRIDTTKYSYVSVKNIDGNDPLDTTIDGVKLYSFAPGTGSLTLSDTNLIEQTTGKGLKYLKDELQLSGVQARINDGAVLINSAAYILYNCYWDKKNSYFVRVNTAATAYAIKLGSDGTLKKLSATSNTFTTWTEDNIVTDSSINSKIENTTTGEVSKLVKTTTTGSTVTGAYDNGGIAVTKRYSDLFLGTHVDAKNFLIVLTPVSTGNVAKSKCTGTFIIDRGSATYSNYSYYTEIDIQNGYGSSNHINKFNSNIDVKLCTITYGGINYYAIVCPSVLSTCFFSFNGLWKTTDGTVTIPKVVSDYANNGVTNIVEVDSNHQITGINLIQRVVSSVRDIYSNIKILIKKSDVNAFQVQNNSGTAVFNIDSTNQVFKIGNKTIMNKTGTVAGDLFTVASTTNMCCTVSIKGHNLQSTGSRGFIKEYVVQNVGGTSVVVGEVINAEYGVATSAGLSYTTSAASATFKIDSTAQYNLTIEVCGQYTIS